MFCINCGKQIDDDSKFCPHCGAKEAEETPLVKKVENTSEEKNQKSPDRKKSKVPLLVVVGIFVVVIGYFSFRAISKMTTYNSAVEKYEHSSYVEAEELFTSLGDYKDASEYVTECQYQQAIKDLEAGYYEEAIVTFTRLGEYEDSISYLEKAVSERKYAKFNLEIDVNSEIYKDTALRTPEEVEAALTESIYGEWYSADTNEKIIVDYYKIGDRDYGINSAQYLDGWITVDFHYADDLERKFTISPYFESFNYIDQWIDTLFIYSAESEEEYLYRSVSQEEYDNLVALNAEVEAQQPMYTDDEIIQKTFATFKNRIKGNYSGAGVLYHSADYSNAYVEYDWLTQTYYCSMTGEYSTNVFDFWGTSTQTYFINAVFVDTGTGLSVVSFSIS